MAKQLNEKQQNALNYIVRNQELYGEPAYCELGKGVSVGTYNALERRGLIRITDRRHGVIWAEPTSPVDAYPLNA